MITAQEMINGLDKTTVESFAEAMLIAMSDLRDEQGRHLLIRLSADMDENIRFARDVAKMMLKSKEG